MGVGSNIVLLRDHPFQEALPQFGETCPCVSSGTRGLRGLRIDPELQALCRFVSQFFKPREIYEPQPERRTWLNQSLPLELDKCISQGIEIKAEPVGNEAASQ